MQTYRLRMRDRSQTVIAVQMFEAEDAAEARLVAGALCHASADVVRFYELWQGDKPVHIGWAGDVRPTAADLNERAQHIVLEREIALHDSLRQVAESLRLLARIEDWTKTVTAAQEEPTSS